MPEIQFPLLRGIHEEADSKLLPQGALARAENVRFQKEGRIVSRYGYALATGAQDIVAAGSASYGLDRSIHFGERTTPLGSAHWWQRRPDGTFSETKFGSCDTSLETPRRTVVAPLVKFSAIASDCAYANGYVFVVYNDYDAIGNTDGALLWSVYDRQTMQILTSGVIVAFGASATPYFNPKCIALGDDIMVFYRDGEELLLYKFTTATLTGAAVTLSPTLPLTAIGAHQISFDICPYDADEVAVATELVVAGVSTGIACYRVTAGGVVTIFANPVTYGADEKEVAIAKIPTGAGGFGVAAITAGNVKWASFSAAGAALTAVTDIDASGDAIGAPCLGSSATFGNMLAWAVEGLPAGKLGAWAPEGWSSATAQYVPSLWPVCKPFTTGEFACVCWCVDETHNADDAGTFPGAYGTYRLVDLGTLYARDIEAGAAICEAVCAQEEALAGNWYLGESFDQRRHTIEIEETHRNGSDVDTRATALPTLVGAATTAGKVDLVEFRSGTYVDRLYPAKINGQLFLSGARVTEFDGSQHYESGLLQGPKEITFADDVGGGDIQPGTYLYCFHYEWIDAGGRLHRSQVCEPREFVHAGDPGTCTILIAPPPFSDRTAQGSVTFYVRAFRTTNNGSVFHLLNPDERITFEPDISGPITFVDTQDDDAISDNETVYIGNDDILNNAEPPPCKFIWAGEDRVIVGGLEDPTMYGFSKKLTPGYAIAFVSDDETNFYGSIEGDVTGVAQLDGTWFIGSEEAIWAVVGQGPDDSGSGVFSPPRKVPSDTGFVSQRSIVELPQGLMFLGRGGKMYLIPRGGGAPVWVGKAVQDTLDAYPFVTCAVFVPEEHVAIWACWSIDDDDGRFIVYDTDTGEWIVDKPHDTEEGSVRQFHSACVFGGKPLFDGSLEETDAYTDDHDGFTPLPIPTIWETGDIRPFGPSGTGRGRRMTVLGEAASDYVNVTIEVSRDSGVTWDPPNGSAPGAPAGAWSGTTFDDYLQLDLPIVRDSSFRFRVTATSSDDEGVEEPGAGCVFNAVSFEVYPERGLKRLAASKRA